MNPLQEKLQELGPRYRCNLDEPHGKDYFFTGLCIVCGKATIYEKDRYPIHKQIYWQEGDKK